MKKITYEDFEKILNIKIDESLKTRIKDLDLKYIPDLEIAFNEALARLRNDHPELDFDAIEANKESFFK